MLLQEKAHSIIKQAKTIIFGQDELLESIVAALVCEGHLLIEGLPGLGKTLSVSVMSRLCDLHFQRIQFTPDLLPSDLIGTMIYNQQKQEFSTKFGPIFTQLVLADEINRSPAKVQAALLEAMAEKQVTIGDKTHKLPTPFVVLATQNPIEQEGTYNLPEAQLDRFMMKISVDYPDFEAEKSVLSLKPSQMELKPVINQNDLIALRTEYGVDKLVPGLTGWAQVNGRDDLTIQQKVALDLEYMCRQSIWFDLDILWLTALKIFSRDKISH